MRLYEKYDVHKSVHRNIFLWYNQQDAPVSQIIYSCKTLYMFRTAFPSIIRSSKLHIRQQAYVKLKLQGRVKLRMDVYVGYSKM